MNITGEQYIRTLAQYIRSNEKRLTATSSQLPSSGHLSGHRRTDSGGGSFTMSNLWSFSTALTSLKPTISTPSTTPTSPSSSINSLNKIFTSLDPHHLYYLLTKFSDLGLDVGVFEPMADFKRSDTLDIDNKDIETSSITSLNSISSMSSAMSSLSLFTGWQGWYSAAQKNDTIPINLEIQYIYRAFTRLTGLNLAIINQKKINGFENWHMGTMLSLTLFKHLTHLEINGLAPKMFDGWDILQEKLEYLSLQKGSIDDIYELFVDTVVDGMKRRKPKDNITDDQITKESQHVEQQPKAGLVDYSPDSILPQKIWPNLKHVDLSDNALTFVANEPLGYINKVITLDLSQNLLIAVPTGLSQLYNLQYLNLNNNMIESVTGIYTILGNITKLDLRNNRIENLCGLERLWSLEYIDVRENKLMDWAEVGRMTELQEIKHIHVEGNPFTRFQPNYRLSIFAAYRENNKDIILDGSGPSYNERRHIPTSPKSSPKNQQIPTAIPSVDPNLSDPVLSSDEQITKIPVLRTKKSRKFHKRVVKLDGGNSTDTGSDLGDAISIKSKSDKDKKKKKDKSDKKSSKTEPIPIKHRLVEVEKAVAAENDPLRKKKSGRLRSNTIELSPKLRPSSPLSPRSDSELVVSPGEDYRRKIEELRTEGGSAWLRVLSEMEYAKGGVDRLREPPKMKAIADQFILNRDHS